MTLSLNPNILSFIGSFCQLIETLNIQTFSSIPHLSRHSSNQNLECSHSVSCRIWNSHLLTDNCPFLTKMLFSLGLKTPVSWFYIFFLIAYSSYLLNLPSDYWTPNIAACPVSFIFNIHLKSIHLFPSSMRHC